MRVGKLVDRIFFFLLVIGCSEVIAHALLTNALNNLGVTFTLG